MGLAFKRMYIDIPADQHAEFKALAETQGKSMSALIRELIAEKLHQERKPGKRKK